MDSSAPVQEVGDVLSHPTEPQAALWSLCDKTPNVYKQVTLHPGTAVILVIRMSLE